MASPVVSDRAYAAPLSPEVTWYCETRGYGLKGVAKPLWRTPEPGPDSGARFNPARVDQHLAVLARMRHTQGEWAGRPIEPLAWQVAYVLAPGLGWETQADDGAWTRWYRHWWIEVPRKNGKTTISAAVSLALTFADGEPGAQGLLAAGSKDQARLAYDPLRLVVSGSPDMLDAGVRPWKGRIIREADGSTIRPVASLGDTLHGTNPHVFLADEMHVHKSLDLIEALETGQGSRRQPLGIVITTADAGGRRTPYAIRRSAVEAACRAEPSDRMGVIWAAPKGSDPWAEDTWARANPGWGVTVKPEFMRSAARAAREGGPEAIASFKRLHLNIRTKQESRYISMGRWDRGSTPDMSRLATLGALEGRPVVGGLDLASVSDLAALCWLTPRLPGDPDGTPAWTAVWRTWTPEGNIERLDRRTLGAASSWVERGLLELTPGDVLDFDVVEQRVLQDVERLDVEELGYDPWAATQIASRLYARGVPMVKVRQGYATLSPPTKRLKTLVYAGALGHSNPIADWCADNLAVERDPSGNVKPNKAKSGEKIDLVAALVTALTCAMARESRDGDEGGAILL